MSTEEQIKLEQVIRSERVVWCPPYRHLPLREVERVFEIDGIHIVAELSNGHTIDLVSAHADRFFTLKAI
jgi:hypothetical protein